MAWRGERGELRLIARRLPCKSRIGGIDANTVLMLHCEDYTDSSKNNLSLATSGSVSLVDGKFNKAFYLYGGYVRGSYALGSGDFTIDFWIKRLANSNYWNRICTCGEDSTTGGWYLDFQGGGTNKIRMCTTGGSSGYLCDTEAFQLNVWTHIAYVRKSNLLYLFKNGSLITTSETNANFTSNVFYLGYDGYGAGSPLYGYLDEFRISNIARWTENFTPPDQPYS